MCQACHLDDPLSVLSMRADVGLAVLSGYAAMQRRMTKAMVGAGTGELGGGRREVAAFRSMDDLIGFAKQQTRLVKTGK